MCDQNEIIAITRFERLLEETIRTLTITLQTAPSMGNFEFEDSVARAMEHSSEILSYDWQITQTDRDQFPDIVVDGKFGVEVKQVQKNSTSTRGNSIFETTRIDEIKHLYLILSWNASESPKVAWRKYADAIGGIVITHSPRYLIDITLGDDENMFAKLDTTYAEFRELAQNEKMAEVRKLYDQSSSDLWWVDTQDKFRNPLRRIEDLDNYERYKVIGEALFLCPVIFGNEQKYKYSAPLAYWLSLGLVAQVVRDKFTSSGKKEIIDASNNVDTDLIKEFWQKEEIPSDKTLINQWFDEIKIHYEGDENHIEIFIRNFLFDDT